MNAKNIIWKSDRLLNIYRPVVPPGVVDNHR